MTNKQKTSNNNNNNTNDHTHTRTHYIPNTQIVIPLLNTSFI